MAISNTYFPVQHLGVLLMAIAAYSVSHLMTPFYRVTTVVADASDTSGNAGLLSALGQLGSLASLAGVGGLASEVRASDEALAVLTSDDFLDRFVTAHGLMPVLYAKKWDAKNKVWTTKNGKPPTIGATVRYLRGLIITSRDRRTSLISVSVDWQDRELAARWCQMLINDLNAEMQNRAAVRSREHIQYLRKQIEVEAALKPGRPSVACSKRSSSRRCSRRFRRTTYSKL